MPKLYYTPTSCGAANFIAAYVGGLNIPCEEVDIQTHKTLSGADFYAINPKGNVPCLVLDDGKILNENNATLQFLADMVPGKVAPANGTVDRALLQNALSYISSEVHATVGHLFNPTLSAEIRDYVAGKYATKLKYCNDVLLGSKTFLVGNSFTVADSLLNFILSWCPYVGVDLSPYPNLVAYVERFNTNPKVR